MMVLRCSRMVGEDIGAISIVPYLTVSAIDEHRFASVVQGPAVMGVAIAYVWVVAECVVRLLKLGSLRDVLPTLALMTTQSLWFAAPILSAPSLTAMFQTPYKTSTTRRSAASV